MSAQTEESVNQAGLVYKAIRWTSHQLMHVWRLELTIEKLLKARNELIDLMLTVLKTMEDARRDGWLWLIPTATGWIREGQVFTDRADTVMSDFEKKIINGDHSTSIFLCPCEAVSRRTLNARAILRMNHILEHKSNGQVYNKGAFEDVVARQSGPADDRETFDLNTIRSQLTAQASRYPNSTLARPLGMTAPSSSMNQQTHVVNHTDGPDAVVASNSYPVTAPLDVTGQALVATGAEMVQLNAFTMYRALPRSQSYESVPVLIRVKAPRYSPRSRAPIDLVLVLDVAGSPYGGTARVLWTSSIRFAVHNLEATDRLCIVRSDDTTPLLALTAMSDEVKRSTKDLIESLTFSGGNCLLGGMEVAYKILSERPDDEDRVSSIIVLTNSREISDESIESAKEYPTYALGIDGHDSYSLYSLATRYHGTYSFTMKQFVSIKEAMAVYIGGLTSIVAKDVKISIDSAHRDVKISDIACGGYHYIIDDSRKSGSITVDDLCGNEEKNFLIYVNVPQEKTVLLIWPPKTTNLLTVSASYSPLTGAQVHAGTINISLDRHENVMDHYVISPEVASEVTRANVFKGVEEICREVSERKGISIMTKKLNDLRDSIDSTEESKAAKDRWDDLRKDLTEMAANWAFGGGDSLSYMLSWLSSHQWQRAATPGSSSKSRWFRTVRMQNMIDSVGSVRSS